LTLLGIAFLYILLVFLGVVEDIVSQESIVAVDTRFANLLYAYRSATVVKVFLWITLLGKVQIVLCLALVVTVLFWLRNKRAYSLPLWISIGGCCLPSVLGKIVLSPQTLRISTGLLLLACAVFYVHTGLRYHPAKHPALEEEAEKVVVENIVTGFEGLQLPRHTESITAKEGKSLNLVIIAADDSSLTSAMLKAGWLLPDSISFGSVTRLAATRFQRGNYLTAPITPVFWNSRSHELNFVKPGSTGTLGMRHEVRFWRTRLSSPDGRATYVGLVTRTAGFKWRVIPMISPDIDRDGLSHDLHAANQVVSDNDELFVKPVIRQDFGEQKYFTEGLVCVITLR
jgi:hypothetical protein